jgi:biotin synthase-related radical SAM superfamily protein
MIFQFFNIKFKITMEVIMTGKIFFLLSVSFVLIFFNSILHAEEYPAAGSKIKICILAYDTEFKNNLTEALVKDLNAKGISVTVDTVSSSSNYSAADYDAVILLSGMRMWKPLSGAVKFLKTNNYSSNIIYVVTHGEDGKAPDNKNIDTITSASVKKNNKAFDEVKNKIIERAIKILGK